MNALAGPDLDVRLGTTVTQISHDARGVTVATVGGETYTARACVMAVPAWTLGDIVFEPPLGTDKQEMLSHEHYIKGVKRVFLVEGAPAGFFGVGGLSSKVQWLFEDRVLDDGRTLLVGFSLYEDLTGNDIDVAQAAIEEYIPGVRVVAVDGEDWYGDPLTRGIVGFCPTGLGRRFSAVLVRPEGPIAFAGAEFTTSATFWGWMEGAVDTGPEAARYVSNTISRAALDSAAAH